MHDSRGAPLKAGDRVFIEAQVTSCSTSEDTGYCNCTVQVVTPGQTNPPEMTPPTLSAINTRMLTKVGLFLIAIALALAISPAYAEVLVVSSGGQRLMSAPCPCGPTCACTSADNCGCLGTSLPVVKQSLTTAVPSTVPAAGRPGEAVRSTAARPVAGSVRSLGITTGTISGNRAGLPQAEALRAPTLYAAGSTRPLGNGFRERYTGSVWVREQYQRKCYGGRCTVSWVSLGAVQSAPVKAPQAPVKLAGQHSHACASCRYVWSHYPGDSHRCPSCGHLSSGNYRQYGGASYSGTRRWRR